MANVFIDENILQGWADTVREKTGTTDKMLPSALLQQTQENWGTGGGSTDLVKYVTFLNEDGTTLYQMPVLVGDDCKDPVTHGDISKPEKEDTTTIDYTYSGWTSAVGGAADANILKNITEDKTVYAAYTESVRYYTVTFYDGETLLETVKVAYGGTATPTETPSKDDYFFDGWQPSNENITADTVCYAQWGTATSFAESSWETIVERAKTGNILNYYSIGDTKDMTLNYADGTSETVTVELVNGAFSDSSHTFNAFLFITTPVQKKAYMTKLGYYKGTYRTQTGGAYEILNTVIYPVMPEALKNAMIPKSVVESGTTYEDLVWIPNKSEINYYNETNFTNGRFNSDAERVLYKYGTNVGVKWWTTFVGNTSNGYSFYQYVSTVGAFKTAASDTAENYSAYIAFGFFI